MNLPKTLKIDGEIWQLKIVEQNGLGDDYIGRTSFPTHTITLDGFVNDDRMASTLLHEILHVISGNRGLNLKEVLVESVSMGLFAIIADNNLDFTKGDK